MLQLERPQLSLLHIVFNAMIEKSKDKMIGNESKRDFHFSGAGSNLPPVIIKASSVEEAEKKWREMNDAAAPTGNYTKDEEDF